MKGKKRGRVKAEDDPREEFALPDGMVDEGGLIKAWPEDCEFVFGAEKDCHRPFSKKRFADEETWVDYRIAGKQSTIALIQEEIDAMKKSRNQFSNIANLKTRKNAKKAKALRNQMKALMEQCVADGCTMEELLADD